MSKDQHLVHEKGYDGEGGEILGPLPTYLTYLREQRKRQKSISLGSFRRKMSRYYYPPQSSPEEEEEFDFDQPFSLPTTQPQQAYQSYAGQTAAQLPPQRQLYPQSPQLYQSPPQYQGQLTFQQAQQTQANQMRAYQSQVNQQSLYPAQNYQPQSYQQQGWVTPTVPSNYPYGQGRTTQFPQYTEPTMFTPTPVSSGPSRSRTSTGYLSPDEAGGNRQSRATSNASSVTSDASRSASPNAAEMARYGYRNENGNWSCAYPGCTSRSTFNRGCDLRKHYKRHTKTLFCRIEGCPQSTEGGFSSKKDRARHEAKHNPSIACEWEGCDRLFSRVDNMKDHVRRVHRRKGGQ